MALTIIDPFTGICLPATCKTGYLSYVLNQVAIYNGNSIAVGFPPLLCQTEERATDWKPIDLVTMYVFRINKIKN